MTKDLFYLSDKDFWISSELTNCLLIESKTFDDLNIEGIAVILLFCGWYDTDVKAMGYILDNSNLIRGKVGVKNFFDEDDIYTFHKELKKSLRPPCYLFLKENRIIRIVQGRILLIGEINTILENNTSR